MRDQAQPESKSDVVYGTKTDEIPNTIPLRFCQDVPTLQNAVSFLWDLLDSIDTAGDVFKENNEGYRQYVEDYQRQRFNIAKVHSDVICLDIDKTPDAVEQRKLRVLEQSRLWLGGICYHNTVDNECTPDFSCCKPELFTTSMQERVNTYRACTAKLFKPNPDSIKP